MVQGDTHARHAAGWPQAVGPDELYKCHRLKWQLIGWDRAREGDAKRSV